MSQTSSRTDTVYYETLDKFGVVAAVWRLARRRMLADFMSMTAAKPVDTILDIGVSDIITDEANFLEQYYPHRANITCAGLGDGARILEAYPGLAYRRIEPNAPLPFPDKHFTIATCNAVLEHVGDDDARRAMIADMLRVAERVLIAIPNRWFPVEHHTALPFVHFWPAAFRALCPMLGKGYWANPSNLELLGPTRLKSLFPRGIRVDVRYSGLPLGPFSSNLICIAGPA
jgi:SAM-dependent methyltransferase